MGIVGLGRIGRAVAELALAFGMRVLAHSRTVPVHQPNLHPTRSEIRPETDAETLPSREGVGGESPRASKVAFVDLETLFRQSDVISLHCPLTPQTLHLVNIDRLSLMKPTAFLLNTSRNTVELLKQRGYKPVSQVSEGGHTWINWRNYLSEFAPQLFQAKTAM